MLKSPQVGNAAISDAGIVWLKLAVVYLLAGIALGIGMGASENFTLRPVHAHINLLGWTTMGLAGLIYSVFPALAASKLARIHFWLLNIATPAMMAALAVLLLGNPKAVPFLATAEIGAALGIVAFAANIFINLRKK